MQPPFASLCFPFLLPHPSERVVAHQRDHGAASQALAPADGGPQTQKGRRRGAAIIVPGEHPRDRAEQSEVEPRKSGDAEALDEAARHGSPEEEVRQSQRHRREYLHFPVPNICFV